MFMLLICGRDEAGFVYTRDGDGASPVSTGSMQYDLLF